MQLKRILVLVIVINCMFYAHTNAQKKIGKYNHEDKLGRAQGFWKTSLPDEMGHSSNYEEGVFYNDKKVGIWYRKNYRQQIYQMEIFYDTSQNKREHFSYYIDSQNIKEHGMYLLTALGRTDTLDYIDPLTNKKKRLTWDSSSMKQGKWTYYYKNGEIECEGSYLDNNKKGVWKYYNEKGELLKTEEN